MATPNYGYEKRQRELAKKKKKEEKLKAKASGKRPDEYGSAPDEQSPDASQEPVAPSGPATPAN